MGSTCSSTSGDASTEEVKLGGFSNVMDENKKTKKGKKQRHSTAAREVSKSRDSQRMSHSEAGHDHRKATSRKATSRRRETSSAPRSNTRTRSPTFDFSEEGDDPELQRSGNLSGPTPADILKEMQSVDLVSAVHPKTPGNGDGGGASSPRERSASKNPLEKPMVGPIQGLRKTSATTTSRPTTVKLSTPDASVINSRNGVSPPPHGQRFRQSAVMQRSRGRKSQSAAAQQPPEVDLMELESPTTTSGASSATSATISATEVVDEREKRRRLIMEDLPGDGDLVKLLERQQRLIERMAEDPDASSISSSALFSPSSAGMNSSQFSDQLRNGSDGYLSVNSDRAQSLTSESGKRRSVGVSEGGRNRSVASDAPPASLGDVVCRSSSGAEPSNELSANPMTNSTDAGSGSMELGSHASESDGSSTFLVRRVTGL